jgi:elongation factor G
MAESEPASCFIFKTALDQFTGKLSYFKVMSGRVAADADLLNAREGKKEKLTKVYTCQGKKLEDVADLAAGDLGLFTKSPTLRTNDSLHSPDAQITYPPLALPTPVHALAISAKAKKDEDKMNQMLQRTMEEDLTFQIAYEKETKETVIAGMGELHISMILDRIRENQKIDMETRVPRVAYRETIQGKADAEYTHKKQTGGHGQYAKVSLEVNPIPRGERYKFTNAIFGGAISKGYVPGVEKGVIEAMEAGVLAGYPVVDVEARVVDGKEHPVDSSELAFKLAAREAFRECMRNAKPVLLEPICNLTVYVDDTYLGAVLSDLSAKRGKVLGQNPIGGGILEIKAQVPQAELMRYAIDLKALTAGTGSFELEFDHYSPISGRIAEDVIKAAQAAKAEEKRE